MSLLHERGTYTPHGAIVERFEIGMGIFKSDTITVFDASKTEQAKVVAPHVSDINSLVSDILESEANPQPIESSQPKIKTVRKPLGIRKMISFLPTILG